MERFALGSVTPQGNVELIKAVGKDYVSVLKGV